jgi:hypothetical protein
MNKTLVTFIIASIFSTCCAQTSTNEINLASSKQNIQEQPLKVIQTDQTILNWANKHIIEIYTYYFEDIDKWRIKIKPYFSSQGYEDFLDSMKKSKTLDKVERDKLIVQPSIEGNSTIPFKNANTWYVVIPLQITYLGPHEKTRHHLLAKLEIVRRNNAGNTDYIVINSLEVYPNDKTEKLMKHVIKKIKEKATLDSSRSTD